MFQEIIQYIIVFGLSMFKFILGPVTGKLYELNFIETTLLTSLGMMASVFIFSSVFGNKIHAWILSTFYKKKKLFSSKNRRTVKIWRNYGLKGVAFLTPVIFTPIGGTILALSFGENKSKIYKYMFISAVFWAAIFSLVIISLEVDNILAVFSK